LSPPNRALLPSEKYARSIINGWDREYIGWNTIPWFFAKR